VQVLVGVNQLTQLSRQIRTSAGCQRAAAPYAPICSTRALDGEPSFCAARTVSLSFGIQRVRCGGFGATEPDKMRADASSKLRGWSMRRMIAPRPGFPLLPRSHDRFSSF
jgi:hypothetical protein